MQTPDTDLLAKVRHGDPAAFHSLVDRHADPLFRVAFSLVGNRADAEDVLQETFAAAFKGAGAFRHEASVKTWLTRILVRQAALVRRKRRGGWVPLDEDAHPARGSGAAEVDSRSDVATMLQALSDEHRQVIVLRELQGLSYEEMAAALGVPRGTVESRLHRARQELKRRFTDDG